MNIFVVEDSRSIRHVLVRRLEDLRGARVVGEAESEAQAVALIRWAQPDTVLLDLHLAQGGLGLNVLRALRRERFAGRVFVMSHQALNAYREACFSAGADGFYDKGNDIELLCEDLAVLIGEPAPAAADALVERLRQLTEAAEEDGDDLALCVVHGVESLPYEPGELQIPQGPDRLCVVRPGISSAEEAARFAEGVRAAAAPAPLGMAIFPGEAISARSLLALAEARACGVLPVFEGASSAAA